MVVSSLSFQNSWSSLWYVAYFTNFLEESFTEHTHTHTQVHSKNPNVVNWSSSIYISSALLVLFNDDPRMYLVIGALTILPHLLDEIKKRCLRDTSDENALQVLRAMFVFANKLVLLYISWVTWSSLLLTTALFFKEIFVYILFALYVVVFELDM